MPEGVHLWGKLLICREGNVVDEVLDVGQGLTVERRDAASEAVDEDFELVVWNGAVDIPVPLGKVATEVLAPK